MTNTIAEATPRVMFNSFIDVATLDKNRPRTVVFYGRVSTEHEAQLSALENQMQWYNDEADRHKNWTVVDTYIDEGITGTQAKKRPAFLKMIEDAKQGKFDLIVTREVCRFARNVIDALEFTRMLRSIGVEVYFTNDNIWTFDGNDELKLGLMATFAQEESRKVSERVKAGQRISRENKTLYGNGNILGYDLDKEHNTYIINPEQAETVRMVYQLYSEGMGDTKIAMEMCRLHRKSGEGTVAWNAGKVGRILKNATYEGYICYNKSRSNNFLEQKRVVNHDRDTFVLVKGDFEPIVSEELWNKCDNIRTSKTQSCMRKGQPSRKGHKLSPDVWLHKLRCKCGSKFRKNKWRKNQNGEEAYGYQCYNQLNHGSRTFREKNGLDTEDYCDIRMICDWKLDLMGKTVFKELWENSGEDIKKVCEYINEYGVESNVPEAETGSNFNSAAIEKLRRRIENLTEMRADGELSKEEYTAAKSKAEAEIRQLEAEERPTAPVKNISVNMDTEFIQNFLFEMAEFNKNTPSHDFIEKAVSVITPVDNEHYEWVIRLSDKDSVTATMSIGGRKTKPSVAIEGICPLTYDIVMIDAVAIKKAVRLSTLHRLLLDKQGVLEKSEDLPEIVLSWEFRIDFETAKAFRKSGGNYLRAKQWEDLTVEVRIS